MKYGWLGKQAFLGVDKIVSIEEYGSFVKFAKHYQQNLELLVQQDKNIVPIEENRKTPNEENPLDGVFALFAPISDFGTSIGKWFQQMSLNDKIEEQQYSCAVMKFYLDDLSKFLGL